MRTLLISNYIVAILLLFEIVQASLNGKTLSLFRRAWVERCKPSPFRKSKMLFVTRGGSNVNQTDSGKDAVAKTTTTTSTLIEDMSSNDISPRELTLDEKVHAAMRKLGLDPPSMDTTISNTINDKNEPPNLIALNKDDTAISDVESTTDSVSNQNIDADNCSDGICTMPTMNDGLGENDGRSENSDDPSKLAENISQSMQVDINMAWAALGATSVASENNTRIYNERAAREMLQVELDMISQIQEDSEDVKSLVLEGYDSFYVRRALAFADRNIDDARAILLADKIDDEEEVAANAARVEADDLAFRLAEKNHVESSFKTLDVDANFDPTSLGVKQQEPSIPTAASRDSVIFDATASQVLELVLESPVPVLLDIYADWCGPCKALSPILEEMAVKSGGTLRLVKVNSDNERAISQALDVTALPTIFGIRDGKILHMFQGMPKSEEMMKNFLMGLLIPGHAFNPPISPSQQKNYIDLSTKLLKVATTASFSFSARERLQDRIAARLDELVEQSGSVYDAEQAVVTIRSLLSNIIRDPFDMKFRSINLSNKVIATKVVPYPACMSILKSIGFSNAGNKLTIGKNKAFVNVAPLSVTRDAIDKWIDRTRYEVAREARKRRDEEDRISVQADLAVAKKLAMEAEQKLNEDAFRDVDPNLCVIKFRIDGKKRIHEISLHADDPLVKILDYLPDDCGINNIPDDQQGEVQITCVSKRLIIKCSDHERMNKSFRFHGLVPSSTIVIKLPTLLGTSADNESKSRLADRASSKKLKKGTHTMQSIGVYSTEDNAKGELIDGGGGTWYEQDVSDDEEEPAGGMDDEANPSATDNLMNGTTSGNTNETVSE